MGSKCSICSDRARRDLVDTGLMSGDSPAELLKRYGTAAVGSQSALYRHARSHRGKGPLTQLWASGDSTVLEVIADLGQLRKALLTDFAKAREVSGASVAASRAAREATNVSAVLLREAGTDDEVVTRELGNHAELQKIVQLAALAREGLATELADVAESLSLSAWPAEFRGLEVAVKQHRERNQE